MSGRVGTSAQRRDAAIGLLAVLAVLVTACAAGPNPQAGTMGESDVGFWFGLWHGIIAPVTFVISLFNEEVGIYEVRNAGAWYDFGFVLGLGFVIGGGSSGARGARR